ncbi:MAG TPA: protein-glutamate O-methyltransferase CheR [Candidatus Sulfotelmatobacter sp.]|nr:protein-glutamate O-methyltransferase CheR [Candidatus Sulfotelmatobacter sp.]
MSDRDVQPDRLSSDDYQRVVSFIMSAVGIKLPASKKTMVEGRLNRRARLLGIQSLSDYVAAVFDHGDHYDEVIHLIDAITTNKTDFFREPAHFQFLVKTVLPQMAKAGRVGKFWSAACSIGAEPYTLAMVLSDFALTSPGFRFSILASDVSTKVLTKAARAVFPEEMVEPVPLAMRQRYLLRSRDPKKPMVRMAPEIRNLVRFARINLIEESYPADCDMDVIFCRNLLIYFDRETQEQVLRQLLSHLAPGGYLILGHTDSIAGMNLHVEWLGNSIFRRKPHAEDQGSHRR